MRTPEEIKKALQDGIDAGKHDATPGNIFRTAWPAAEEHGYRKGTLRDVFTTGYLSELPSGGVLVDADGRTKAEQPQAGDTTPEEEESFMDFSREDEAQHEDTPSLEDSGLILGSYNT